MDLAKARKHIRSSIRRMKIEICLLLLKREFLNGSCQFKNQLRENGYNYSLVCRPYLLFDKRVSFLLPLPRLVVQRLLIILKKLVNQGYFNARKDVIMLRSIGLQEAYIKYFSFVLDQPFFKCYDLANVDLSGEKIVVYSVLTGKYDYVHEILYKQPNVDYILFTNNKDISSRTWDVKYVESDLDDLLLSREIKILPCKYLDSNYTASVYIDANAYIYGDIANLCSYLCNGITFMGTKHFFNKSIREEIDACIKCGKIRDAGAVLQQYDRYVKEGFKDDLGLMECGLLVRRHNDEKLIELMNEWWNEYKNGVHRDQISLMACINRLDFEAFDIEDGSVWYNQFETIIGH